jgi:hypothetical protein
MSNNDIKKENKTKIKKMLAFDIFQTRDLIYQIWSTIYENNHQNQSLENKTLNDKIKKKSHKKIQNTK